MKSDVCNNHHAVTQQLWVCISTSSITSKQTIEVVLLISIHYTPHPRCGLRYKRPQEQDNKMNSVLKTDTRHSYAPLKRRSVSTRLHGATSQNTAIFIPVTIRPSNLTIFKCLGITVSVFNLCHVAIYLIDKYIIYLKQSNATFVCVTIFNRKKNSHPQVHIIQYVLSKDCNACQELKIKLCLHYNIATYVLYLQI
jgi:hypothetical protein